MFTMKPVLPLAALLVALPLSALAEPSLPQPQASRNAMIMPGHIPWEGMDPSAGSDDPAQLDVPLYHIQG